LAIFSQAHLVTLLSLPIFSRQKMRKEDVCCSSGFFVAGFLFCRGRNEYEFPLAGNQGPML
jgi:hypothetical protein